MSGVERWTRRRFVKNLGSGALVALAVQQGILPARAAQPCAYGSGAYGNGLYSGTYSAALPAIRVDRSTDDVILSWDAGPSGVTYEVWRSDQPFTPGDPGSTLVGVAASDTLVDPGALTDPSDLYYVVRGVASCE